MISEALFSPPDLPLWLLRLIFSVTLVCLAATFANLLLRRLSAAVRHRIWALSVAASLAMPAMIFWSPEVRLGWVNVSPPRAAASESAKQPDAQPTVMPTRGAPRVPAAPGVDSKVASAKIAPPKNESGVPKTAPAQNPVATTLSTQPDASASQPRIAAANAAPTFFLFRFVDRSAFWVLILAVPATCGLWQSVRCARAARCVVEEAQLIRDPETQELISDVCRRLGWHGAIELRQTKRTPIPLCVGWWRPCVLLPPDWRNWGTLTLRAVLAHEVSHVVRRDLAWQFVARIACFLYWFHPLVWFAARKMRIERESACDDSVLEMVDQPVDYASVLLRFAREMVARSTPARAALPMASLSGLEGRVQAILDKSRRRSPVGTRAGRIFAIAAMLIAATAASLSPLSWEVAAANVPASGSAAPDAFRPDESWTAGVGQPTKRAELGSISGRVVMKSAPQRGAARAKILGIPENPKASFVIAVADAQGNFGVPRLRSAMLFLAQNDERTLSGIARIEPQDAAVVIPVGHSVVAHGRLLDASGKPLGSWPLQYRLVLDGLFLDEFHVSQTADAKRLLGGMSATTPSGEFTLPNLAPGWTYRVTCCTGAMINNNILPFVDITTFTAKNSRITQLGDVTRPRTQTMDDFFLSASRPAKEIEKVLDSAVDQAKIADLRVLCVAGSSKNETWRGIRAILAASSPVNLKLGPNTEPPAPQWATDTFLRDALGEYAVFGVEASGSGATKSEFLDRHKLAAPAHDDIALAILDIDGRVVAESTGRQLFGGKSPSARPLGKWLHTHAPKMPDAEKVLAEALVQARQENKRVFLRENAPGTGVPYCSRLGRYFEQYKPLFEKDYVCVKIDMRYVNAESVINRIRDYDYVSYPWMAILDASGKPMVSSTGPHGNIGAPDSPQEASYFNWMLRVTSQQLTDEEINKLVSGLSGGRS